MRCAFFVIFIFQTTVFSTCVIKTLFSTRNLINNTDDEFLKLKLTSELDARSYNSQITRLDALTEQINEIIDNLGNKANIKIDNELKSVYNENCENLLSDYDVVLNAEFGRVDEQKVLDIVSYPWSGAVFSDRVWANLDTLRFNTRQILTQGIIRGRSISEMSKDLSKECNNSFSNAARLVRTETANIHAQSDLDAYKAIGVDEFEYMATLESRTCEMCGELDGKHFKVKDAKTGVNYPPIHPNCRCTTVEYDKNEKPFDEKCEIFEDWKKRKEEENGQGSVDIERKKEYNKLRDHEQFESYKNRLGNNCPIDFDKFQYVKYLDNEKYDRLKDMYRYFGRVPEATENDFEKYRAIKEIGCVGTIRVPAYAVDSSLLKMDNKHVKDRGHSVTISDAKRFVDGALFSVTRERWDGLHTNYYSPEGAAYLKVEDKKICTAFKSDEFDEMTKKMLEVFF